MRFVDANVFIYAIRQSPKEDYEISKKILKRIENGEATATSSAVIQEVVDWLEYNNRRKEIGGFLMAVNSYASLEKISAIWENFLPSIPEMYEKQIDFVDSLTLQVMNEANISEIYSHDKDFERVDWVRRIWE